MKQIDAKIDALDLEPIKFKLVKEENWTIEQADQVEKEYKGYLHLCKNYPHLSVVPTEMIDEFWHTHILDTQKYMEDCEVVFGKYLHHFPYVGLRGQQDENNLKDSFEITKALFENDLDLTLTAKEGSTCNGNNCGNSTCSVSNCYNGKFGENIHSTTQIVVGDKKFTRVPFDNSRPRLERITIAA